MFLIWASKTCVTSKDSDQPVRPPSMARVLVYPSLDSLEAVEGICDQWRFWSDCADVQADLSVHWSHKSYCRICRELTHFFMKTCCGYWHDVSWQGISNEKPQHIFIFRKKKKKILLFRWKMCQSWIYENKLFDLNMFYFKYFCINM